MKMKIHPQIFMYSAGDTSHTNAVSLWPLAWAFPTLLTLSCSPVGKDYSLLAGVGFLPIPTSVGMSQCNNRPRA